MSIHFGDDGGRARLIHSLFISEEGQAKKVLKAWLGDEYGRARLIYTAIKNPYFWYDIIETNGVREAIVYGVRWNNWYRDFHNYDIIVPNTIDGCPTIVI